jgi:hypothetical protein
MVIAMPTSAPTAVYRSVARSAFALHFLVWN